MIGKAANMLSRSALVMIEGPTVSWYSTFHVDTEIVPGTTDAAVEKHVPVYEIKDNMLYVCVGEVEHPMAEEHYIEWIAVQTASGNQRKILKPGDAPKATFALVEGDEVQAVYAYCNLHSLWKA